MEVQHNKGLFDPEETALRKWDDVRDHIYSVSTTEAAAIAGVNERSIRRWMQSGKLHATEDGCVPVGELRRLGYDVTHLEKVLRLSQKVVDLERVVALLQAELTAAKERELRYEAETRRRESEAREREATARERELYYLNMLDEALKRAGAVDPSSRVPRKKPARQEPYLWQRILEFVQNSPRPRRIHEVQVALGLEKNPSRELSRLKAKGALVALGDGRYWVPGKVGSTDDAGALE